MKKSRLFASLSQTETERNACNHYRLVRPSRPLCSPHTIGIFFTSPSNDSPLGSRPSTIASTMSGASKVRRMIRLT